jgi:hypothetical protein
MTVYLLWLHDSVLDVYETRDGALRASSAYRGRQEYRDGRWTQLRSGDRWSWTPGERSGFGHVSRLEVEPRAVLP